MAKLKYLGKEVIRTTIGGKDFAFSKGKIFDLPLENSYIASLKAQGFFEEVQQTPVPEKKDVKPTTKSV